MYKEFLTSKEEIPDWFVDSFDLKPEDHFEVQVAIQKYVDGGVSKTINLPKETNSDELSRLLLEYIYDLKGVTVYRDGCRPEQILNKINKEETIKYLKDKNKTINHELTDEDVQCATGSCEV